MMIWVRRHPSWLALVVSAALVLLAATPGPGHAAPGADPLAGTPWCGAATDGGAPADPDGAQHHCPACMGASVGALPGRCGAWVVTQAGFILDMPPSAALVIASTRPGSPLGGRAPPA